jgi:hypothetical protein
MVGQRSVPENVRPQRLKIFLVVMVCGFGGAFAGGLADGFRSGGKSTEIGLIAGCGLGAGLAQGLGYMGKRRRD